MEQEYEAGGDYAGLWPADAAEAAARAGDGAALTAEIVTLRVLLRGVLADPKLGAVDRLIAFGRGADYLARVVRLRAQLVAAAPPDRMTLDTVLARMGLGAEEEVDDGD